MQVEYLRRLGLVDSSIGKAISMRPQLVACDIENGWQRLVKYFKLLGIEDAGIQRMFCVHPSVFCMNLERNIAPKVILYHAPYFYRVVFAVRASAYIYFGDLFSI